MPPPASPTLTRLVADRPASIGLADLSAACGWATSSLSEIANGARPPYRDLRALAALIEALVPPRQAAAARRAVLEELIRHDQESR